MSKLLRWRDGVPGERIDHPYALCRDPYSADKIPAQTVVHVKRDGDRWCVELEVVVGLMYPNEATAKEAAQAYIDAHPFFSKLPQWYHLVGPIRQPPIDDAHKLNDDDQYYPQA